MLLFQESRALLERPIVALSGFELEVSAGLV
jgi:hypothetical protein